MCNQNTARCICIFMKRLGLKPAGQHYIFTVLRRANINYPQIVRVGCLCCLSLKARQHPWVCFFNLSLFSVFLCLINICLYSDHICGCSELCMLSCLFYILVCGRKVSCVHPDPFSPSIVCFLKKKHLKDLKSTSQDFIFHLSVTQHVPAYCWFVNLQVVFHLLLQRNVVNEWVNMDCQYTAGFFYWGYI